MNSNSIDMEASSHPRSLIASSIRGRDKKVQSEGVPREGTMLTTSLSLIQRTNSRLKEWRRRANERPR